MLNTEYKSHTSATLLQLELIVAIERKALGMERGAVRAGKVLDLLVVVSCQRLRGKVRIIK